jgi:excisionase family DNA binding protein
MEPADPPVVLTVDDLHRRLRIGKRKCYELIRQGRIPGVIRLGGSIRISAAAIDRWLDAAGEEASL